MWAEVHKEVTCEGKISLQLQMIGMDFEVAPKNEFEKLFPDVHMVGCDFHWRQALNRNLATRGCTKFFNCNLQFQDIVSKCIALAYVPVEELFEFAMLIEQDWDKHEDQMTDEASDWLLYFMRTYVGELNVRTGRRKSPKFKHTSWSKYREVLDGDSTTSNKAEAWN